MPPRTCIKNKAQHRKRWQALCLGLLQLQFQLQHQHQLGDPGGHLLLLQPLLHYPPPAPVKLMVAEALRTGNRSPSQSKANKLWAERSTNSGDQRPEGSAVVRQGGAWGRMGVDRDGAKRGCCQPRHSMSFAGCQRCLRAQCPQATGTSKIQFTNKCIYIRWITYF